MRETTATAPRLSDRVAEELRALLARRQTTPTALAKLVGVSQTYIWRRLSGEVAFDLDDLDKIAAVLEIETADLLRVAAAGPTLREPFMPAPRRPVDNRPAGGPGRGARTSRVRPPYGHAA